MSEPIIRVASIPAHAQQERGRTVPNGTYARGRARVLSRRRFGAATVAERVTVGDAAFEPCMSRRVL